MASLVSRGNVPDSGIAEAGVPGSGRGAVRGRKAAVDAGRRRQRRPNSTPAEKKKAEQAQGSELAQLLRLEDLTLEIGFQLIPLVDEKQGGQLLNRVRALRRHLSSEMGFLVPPGAYLGQLAAEAARVCGLAARHRDWPLADGRDAAAGRLGRAGAAAAGRQGDARAGIRSSGDLDRCRRWKSRRLRRATRWWTRSR